MIDNGEQDRKWLMSHPVQVSDNELEWFLERVAIRIDSGLSTQQALNLTLSEYFERQLT